MKKVLSALWKLFWGILMVINKIINKNIYSILRFIYKSFIIFGLIFIFLFNIIVVIRTNRILAELDTGQRIIVYYLQNLVNYIKEEPKRKTEEQKKFEQKLTECNVFILNQSEGYTGSGTNIKYNGKFYILSAGHLITNKFNNVVVREKEANYYTLITIKVDWENDLVLFAYKDETFIPQNYTELAETEPKNNEQIYVLGNPLGLEDLLSEGRIIKYSENQIYYLDHTYYGSSGGGLYNKEGKIIGIISAMIPAHIFIGQPLIPFIINVAIRLNTVFEFIKDIK